MRRTATTGNGSAKLKRQGSQLVSATTQLRLTAADGKKYRSDMLDADGIVALVKAFPNNKASGFLDWLIYSIRTTTRKTINLPYLG